MSRTRRLAQHAAALAATLLAVPATVAAQSVLAEGDVVVATTTGVHAFHSHQPAVTLLATTFTSPSIEWEPGTDRLWVVDGDELLRVDVAAFAPGGATLQPIATLPAGAVLLDLDVDRRTGDVWVLEGAGADRAHRFAAPVAAGASPDLVLGLAQRVRAIAVDSVDHPASIVYATKSGLRRQTPGGAPQVESTTNVGAEGAVDVSWQHPRWGTFVLNRESHGIYFSPYGESGLDITLQFPIGPFVERPADIEWLPGTGDALVVGEDGVAPSLFPTGTPPAVNVVRFRPGGGVPGSPPLAALYSYAGTPNGLSGDEPDLTIVGDHAWAAPYGDPSPAHTGETPVLLHELWPSPGNTDFAVEVVGGPAGRPVFVGLGAAPTQVVLGSGTALVAASVWRVAGTTDALGDLHLPAGIPNNPALTAADLHAQAVVFGLDGEPAFTNALQLHVE